MVEREVHNDETYLLDATGVARLYAQPLGIVAKAIKAKTNTVRRNPDSRALQEGLAKLVDYFQRLYILMAEDETAVRRWFNRPNRALDGERPVELLAPGRLPELRSLIEQMEVGGHA